MKTVIVTVVDHELATSKTQEWDVAAPDADGKIRTEIGVWLGNFIGKYRYRTSDWINKGAPKDGV